MASCFSFAQEHLSSHEFKLLLPICDFSEGHCWTAGTQMVGVGVGVFSSAIRCRVREMMFQYDAAFRVVSKELRSLTSRRLPLLPCPQTSFLKCLVFRSLRNCVGVDQYGRHDI